MVKASSAPATRFTKSERITTEKTASVKPKPSASPGSTRPAGIGRVLVRCMRASISASYHMFSAPEAPAPTAMQRSAVKAITGCMGTGASTSPTKAVKTTSDITRGFSSAKKSPTSAVLNCALMFSLGPASDIVFLYSLAVT